MSTHSLLARILPRAVLVAAAACSCVHDGPAGEIIPVPPVRPPGDVQLRPVRRPLSRFESRAALDDWLGETIRAMKERRSRERRATAQPGPTPDAPAEAQADGDPAGAGEESITNNQEDGVDEGDIVKEHGNHLVVLRRGRLFTIDVASGSPRPISRVDLAPARSGNAYGVWYDEMLVQGDTIVVVGYSYENDGTELVLFRIDGGGMITPRARFHLRSNDYYSSRNYASRLVGGRLVFYMPYALLTYHYEHDRSELRPTLPAVRFQQPGQANDDDWREIVVATDIVRPIQPSYFPILHTVVTCDLEPSVTCRARGIVVPPGRNFYVSADAVYVWVSGSDVWRDEDAPSTVEPRTPRAAVYRLPLQPNAEISALRVAGAPTDQFSFREGQASLDVLVRADNAAGDWMWSPESTTGEIALVRMPLVWFDEGLFTVPAHAYTRLPTPQGYSLQNRFIGDHVLYGTGGGWWGPGENADRRVFIQPVAGGRTTILSLPHGIDRIEPMGSSAVVVGSDGSNLHFTSVSLGAEPRVVDRFVQAGATQGETRSHGFFYKPSSEDEGLLGLPIRRGDSEGWQHLVDGSAKVLFLHVQSNRLQQLGALSSGRPSGDDACRVSCVDWYGNARPIFYRGRIFALLGYELVEGRVDGAAITELARTTFLHPG